MRQIGTLMGIASLISFYTFWILLSSLLLDRLEDVKNLPNVSTLGLQQVGQPASLIGEAHVHHCLQSYLDFRIRMGSYRSFFGLLRLRSSSSFSRARCPC